LVRRRGCQPQIRTFGGSGAYKTELLRECGKREALARQVKFGWRRLQKGCWLKDSDSQYPYQGKQGYRKIPPSPRERQMSANITLKKKNLKQGRER
jgi:hypothetical protein